MTTPHATFARCLRDILPRVRSQLQFESRTGKTHPALVAERMHTLQQCLDHHEAAAKAQAQAEARLEDAAHG